METPNLEVLKSFDEHSLPDLDVVTLGALELFTTIETPTLSLPPLQRPLVAGSGNAGVVGQVLFSETNAVVANEDTYGLQLARVPEIDGGVVVSASGGKHAIEITQALCEKNIETWLLTNNPAAPAGDFLAADHVFVFPKNREPYTYNTSTYMGMFLAHTHEDSQKIYEFIHTQVLPCIPSNLADFDAFYLMIPPQFTVMNTMFVTKFDELFGSKVSSRVFTYEQTKHAKTVVPNERELAVSFGDDHGELWSPGRHLHIPLPENADMVTMMAIGYFFIGHIQKQHPPFFKENIVRYTEETSRLFNQTITPIVE